MSAPNGFDAMGREVPSERVAEAYRHAKEMGLNTEDAFTVVGYMADAIERDDPYRALLDGSAGFKKQIVPLDLTGRYRLMAVLCTDPSHRSVSA